MSSTRAAALVRTQAVSPLLIVMAATVQAVRFADGAACYGRVSSRVHR